MLLFCCVLLLQQDTLALVLQETQAKQPKVKVMMGIGRDKDNNKYFGGSNIERGTTSSSRSRGGGWSHAQSFTIGGTKGASSRTSPRLQDLILESKASAEIAQLTDDDDNDNEPSSSSAVVTQQQICSQTNVGNKHQTTTEPKDKETDRKDNSSGHPAPLLSSPESPGPDRSLPALNLAGSDSPNSNHSRILAPKPQPAPASLNRAVSLQLPKYLDQPSKTSNVPTRFWLNNTLDIILTTYIPFIRS